MGATPSTTPSLPTSIQDTSSVVELRRYTLHPGRRHVLVDLFDRELVEPQEAAGMRVLGQFRDADRPDGFVWLRGFPDMASRTESLKAFYGGPVWKAHRAAANATMIDSDDVLLLRPAAPGSGFSLPAERPSASVGQRATSLVVATIYLLTGPVDDSFLRLFETRVAPVMVETGAPPLARLRTEHAENGFPALPVRTGVNAFVWFSSFASPADHDAHLARLARSARWREEVEPELASLLASAPEQLRLLPTARSLLRHRSP